MCTMCSFTAHRTFVANVEKKGKKNPCENIVTLKWLFKQNISPLIQFSQFQF